MCVVETKIVYSNLNNLFTNSFLACSNFAEAFSYSFSVKMIRKLFAFVKNKEDSHTSFNSLGIEKWASSLFRQFIMAISWVNITNYVAFAMLVT